MPTPLRTSRLSITLAGTPLRVSRPLITLTDLGDRRVADAGFATDLRLGLVTDIRLVRRENIPAYPPCDWSRRRRLC